MRGSTKLLLAVSITALCWLLYMVFHDGWQNDGIWEKVLCVLWVPLIIYGVVDFVLMIGILCKDKDVFPIGPLTGLVYLLSIIGKWADKHL